MYHKPLPTCGPLQYSSISSSSNGIVTYNDHDSLFGSEEQYQARMAASIDL